MTVDIEVDYKSADNFLFAYITDISAMGIFIRTNAPEAPGTKLNLSFAPTGGPRLNLEGRVMWVNPFRPGSYDNINPGMGVQFVDLSAEHVNGPAPLPLSHPEDEDAAHLVGQRLVRESFGGEEEVGPSEREANRARLEELFTAELPAYLWLVRVRVTCLRRPDLHVARQGGLDAEPRLGELRGRPQAWHPWSRGATAPHPRGDCRTRSGAPRSIRPERSPGRASGTTRPG